MSSKKSTPKRPKVKVQKKKAPARETDVNAYIRRVFKDRGDKEKRWVVLREKVKKYKRKLTRYECLLADAVANLFEGAGHVDSEQDQSV